MRLRNIFTALVAAAFAFVGCQEEERFLEEFQVSQTMISLPVEGGQVEVTVKATADWAVAENDVWPNVIKRYTSDGTDKTTGKEYKKGQIESSEPSWLSIDVVSGAAGETKLVFSANATDETRECDVPFVCAGYLHTVKVYQMAEKVDLPFTSCADVLAANSVGTVYKVKGTITDLTNYNKYGCFYVNDGTAEVYVYGSMNPTQFKPEVGDIISFEGPWTSYGNFDDVTILGLEKSFIKLEKVIPTEALPCDGGVATVLLTIKEGDLEVVIPEDATWLTAGEPGSIGGMTSVELTAAKNEVVGSRSAKVTFKVTVNGKEYFTVTEITQLGQPPLVTPTIAEVIAAGAQLEAKTEGVVVATYGRGVLISDGTGHILVYNNAAMEQKVGDKIEVVGETTMYGGMLQFKNITATTLSTGNKVVHPKATVLDGAGMDAQLSKTTVEYVEYVGTLSVSGNYYNVTIDGASTAIGSLQYIDASAFPLAVDGAKIKVRGYFIGVSSSKYINTMTVDVLDPNAVVEEVEVKTLTNEEICAVMTSSETSYTDYTIESASGLWSVNASQYKDNTFLQCRGKKGAYIKTPAFEKDIKSVTIHFTDQKKVYADNVYCAFPSTWTVPTEDAAYPEDGNVGRAVTDGSYSVTIPVAEGNKQVFVSIIGTYAYYVDHIDVAF